ncbi:NAD(P)-dependent alcohol dehydrogenase [Microterricola pindariensis]|uniref:Alcohol dehydrogenase n=1 Tax=Microterricola pindariensis TaxID=478010 RepID=A0ABX5AYP5_9MICO|nr:NAD(P)-dependent alcohol dehydrogenase [Microterricola pindariensis]PPL19649.1 alcohol dehydrogenase [Microterricola pindariensis]
MRAAIVENYGAPERVRIAELPVPVPGAGELLVRVHAAAVTSADARIRAARFPRGFAPMARLMFGVRRPRRQVLGSAFSGVVEAVGPAARGSDAGGFAPGDEVSGMTGSPMGAHAEYLCIAASRAVPKPAAVSHEDAAGVLFGGSTALYFLRKKADVAPGTSVLVIGASGAIGTNAVQLAARAGARVTGVCSAGNRALVAGLGAERTIDRAGTEWAEHDGRYDVVLDTVGVLSPASGRRLLTERGVLLLAVADLWQILGAHGNVKSGTAPERPEDVALLLQMLAAGELVSVTDLVAPLEDIAAAHARVDTGRKVGNVIVRP